MSVLMTRCPLSPAADADVVVEDVALWILNERLEAILCAVMRQLASFEVVIDGVLSELSHAERLHLSSLIEVKYD